MSEPRDDAVKRTARLNDAVILALIVLGALLLRLPTSRIGLWRDEATTYFDIAHADVTGTLHEILSGELSPPGYFLLMRCWVHLFGVSEVALKLPSLLFTIGLVVVTWHLGGSLCSRWVGGIAATLVAISTNGIAVAGEARPYALAGLLAACTLWTFFRCLERPDRVGTIAFAFFAIALAYVHYSGLVLIAGLALGAPYVIARERRRAALLPLTFAFAAIAIASVAWLAIDAPYLRPGTRAPWLPPIESGHFLDRVAEQFAYLLPMSFRAGTYAGMIVVGTIVAFVVAIARRIRGEREALPRGTIVVLVVCVIFGSSVEAHLLLRAPRYMFVFSAPAAIWVASIIVWLVAPLATYAKGWTRPARIDPRPLLLVLVTGMLLRSYRAEMTQYQSLYANLEPSGMRALLADAKRLEGGRRTLYVVAPDYLGPTFGYDTRSWRDRHVVGFVQWEHPEHYSCPQCFAQWYAPDAIAVAERRLRALIPGRYDRVAVIVDTSAQDLADAPFGRAKMLAARLERDFNVVFSRRYPGREEPVSLVLLDPR